MANSTRRSARKPAPAAVKDPRAEPDTSPASRGEPKTKGRSQAAVPPAGATDTATLRRRVAALTAELTEANATIARQADEAATEAGRAGEMLTQVASAESKLAAANARLNEKHAELEKERAHAASLERRIDEDRSASERSLEALGQELETIQKQFSEGRARADGLANERAALEAAHADALTTARREHEEALLVLRHDLMKERDRRAEQDATTIAELRAAKASADREHADALAASASERDSERSTHAAALTAMKAELAASATELSEIRKERDAEIAALVGEHEAALQARIAAQAEATSRAREEARAESAELARQAAKEMEGRHRAATAALLAEHERALAELARERGVAIAAVAAERDEAIAARARAEHDLATSEARVGAIGERLAKVDAALTAADQALGELDKHESSAAKARAAAGAATRRLIVLVEELGDHAKKP